MARKIALTGVSRGLGREMVTQFVARGHRVSGCCRSEEAVDQLRAEFGSEHLFHVVDVTDQRAVERWANSTFEQLGTPDLLVNNAAIINRNAPLWQVPPEEFSRVVEINITGVYHVLCAFIPRMIQQGEGVIVNFSSTWGTSTSPEVAPYCATKYAIEGLTSALDSELPSGLKAIAFNPGVINTDMLQSCFGEQAAAFPSPKQWAETAVPRLLDF